MKPEPEPVPLWPNGPASVDWIVTTEGSAASRPSRPMPRWRSSRRSPSWPPRARRRGWRLGLVCDHRRDPPPAIPPARMAPVRIAATTGSRRGALGSAACPWTAAWGRILGATWDAGYASFTRVHSGAWIATTSSSSAAGRPARQPPITRDRGGERGGRRSRAVRRRVPVLRVHAVEGAAPRGRGPSRGWRLSVAEGVGLP